MPFPKQTYSYDINLPYAKVAASVLLVSSLWSCQQSINDVDVQTHNPVEQTLNSENESDKNTKEDKSKAQNVFKGFTTFKGAVFTKNEVRAIEHAKISLYTIDTVYSCYSDKNGNFSLSIPNEILDFSNLFRVNYHEMVVPEDLNLYAYFETDDFVLNKKELDSNYLVSAVQERTFMGQTRIVEGNSIISNPIIFVNGVELSYKEYEASFNKKGIYSLKDKEHYYFEGNVAFAITGEKAKYGLHLYFDKED